jgi:hypothetical protein
LAGYHAFVQKVLADVPLDAALEEWARQCAHDSRGFGVPGGRIDKEQLAWRGIQQPDRVRTSASHGAMAVGCDECDQGRKRYEIVRRVP